MPETIPLRLVLVEKARDNPNALKACFHAMFSIVMLISDTQYSMSCKEQCHAMLATKKRIMGSPTYQNHRPVFHVLKLPEPSMLFPLALHRKANNLQEFCLVRRQTEWLLWRDKPLATVHLNLL
jgi:hypothetical protein